MAASDADSRMLDTKRAKNDELVTENLRLRSQIEQLRLKHEQQARRIRDILGEEF